MNENDVAQRQSRAAFIEQSLTSLRYAVEKLDATLKNFSGESPEPGNIGIATQSETVTPVRAEFTLWNQISEEIEIQSKKIHECIEFLRDKLV